MSMPELINKAGDPKVNTFEIGNTDWCPSAVRCDLAIVKEADGAFTAYVLNLDGADSCGDTEREAIENAKESVAVLVASYKDVGKDVPWKDVTSESIPEGAKRKLVLVNV